MIRARCEVLSSRAAGARDAMLMAFDLLELDGRDLRPWPLHERRAGNYHSPSQKTPLSRGNQAGDAIAGQ